MSVPAAGGDLVLRGGTLVDGTGAPPRAADLLVRAGRIVSVTAPGELSRQAGEVDCRGLHVMPGFVDAHSHADYTLPTSPDATALLRQGVTTIVTGNCGYSPFPGSTPPGAPLSAGAFLNPDLRRSWPTLRAYKSSLEAAGLGVNVVPLVGHSSVRAMVLGPGGGTADPEQQAIVCAHVAQALADGAAGVSLGLAYAEGRDSEVAELTEIARLTAVAGRVLAAHVRDERAHCPDAVAEVLALADRSGSAVHISHLKSMGKANWGGTASTLALIDEARAQGIDATTDMYPYTSGATTLAAALPEWANGGGHDQIRAVLAIPEARSRLVAELAAGGGYFALDEIVFSAVSDRWSAVRGMPLLQAAPMMGRSPADLLVDVLADEGDRASMLVAAMDIGDVRRVLDHPASMVGSDGWVLTPAAGAHPRNFATFVTTLIPVRTDERALAEAVRRQTSAVADRFGVAGRGRLSPGYWADLAVLDLDALTEGGGYLDPADPPQGVRQVFINGLSGWGEPAARYRPGRVLLRA